ncbi:DUF6531 domain-containing protein [Actinopolyspora halophila]|uniref:DUF6531 domain-containing protein n=1 Tax=Actinopolyspora halophila TaxID=1850 RepID=UPI0003652E42|nr:DUF6531 domain-containing protein [Actinopolyspora halophila]
MPDAPAVRIGTRRGTVILTLLVSWTLLVSLVTIPTRAVAAEPPREDAAESSTSRTPFTSLSHHGLSPDQRAPTEPFTKPGHRDRQRAAQPRVRSGTSAAAGSGATDVHLAPGTLTGKLSMRLYFNLPDTDYAKMYFDLLDESGQSVDRWYVQFFPEDLTKLRCGVRTAYCYTFSPSLGATPPPIEAGQQYKIRLSVSYDPKQPAVETLSNVASPRRLPVPPKPEFGHGQGCSAGTSLGCTSVLNGLRGDPVNTATGAYNLNRTDLTLPGFGETFAAERTYVSSDTRGGALGPGWNWSYDMRLSPLPNEPRVILRAEDGSEATFRRYLSGYRAPPGVRTQLFARDGGGFRAVTPDQRELLFAADGRLLSIHDQRGQGLEFGYDGGSLRTVTDAAGRTVRVEHHSNGRLAKLTLPDERYVSYSYDSEGRLSEVRDAEGGTTTYGYDSADRLTTVTDPAGRVVVTNVYDPDSGRIVEQRDGNGASTTYAWDQEKQEATITGPDGRKSYDGYRNGVLQYQENGNGDRTLYRFDEDLESSLVVDPLGRQYRMAHDSSGNLTSVGAPESGLNVTAKYDTHNNPTSRSNETGDVVEQRFNDYGERTTVTAADGTQRRFTYDDRGLLTSVTDERGDVTRYEYDAAGNRVAEISPLGNRTTFGYDSTGNMIWSVGPRGNVEGADPSEFRTTYEYDALDRLRSVTDPRGNKRTISYDGSGNRTSTTDAAGNTTHYEYDDASRPVSTTDPLDRTSTYTYTPGGLLKSKTNPAGERTSYTYNAAGLRKSVTTPRGNVSGADSVRFTTTFEYDFNGNRTAIHRPAVGGGTNTTRTTYDALDRPVSVTDPLGNTREIEYDEAGNVTARIDELDNVTRYDYDEKNRLLSVTDPRGAVTEYEYDVAGNRTATISPLGTKRTWTYDADGRKTSSVSERGHADGADPSRFTTRYSYDAAGNLVSTTDPRGNSTERSYDATNLLTSRTDANGNTVRFGYDESNRLVSVLGSDADKPEQATRHEYNAAGERTARVDPNGNRTTFAYDAAGRLIERTDPLGRSRTFDYDANGNRTKIVTARGNAAGQPGGAATEAAGTITNRYDLHGRLVRSQLGENGPVHTRSYDAAGRRIGTSDPRGSSTYTYDAADRLTSAVRNGEAFEYGYDSSDNVTRRSLPDGSTVEATFDENGRMVSQTTDGGTTNYGYDTSGNLTSIQYPDTTGHVEKRSYDRLGRITSVGTSNQDTPLARFRLTRDPVGNPTEIVTNRKGTSTTASYDYDSANRVTAACYGTTTCTGAEHAVRYEYDLLGNRVTENRTGLENPGEFNYNYDAANQLTSRAGPDKTTEFGYDADGNQVRAGESTYEYDLRDRMTSATVAGTTTELSYDALGNRIAATRGSETTTSRWDINNPLPRLAVQFRPDGSPDRSYRAGPGGTPVMTRTGTTNQYYAHDWIGSVRDVFSQQGEQQYSYDYEPFGSTRNTQQHAESAPSNPLRFTGAYRDDTLGLHNLRDRQYRAETGRFTSTDPATPRADEPHTSTYAYAADRPGVAVDPSGRCWWIPGSGESSCPGSEALSGVGEGLHAVGSATLRGLQQPVEAFRSTADSCDRGNRQLPILGCVYNTTGVTAFWDQLGSAHLAKQTDDRFSHLTQAAIALGTLGRNSLGGPSDAPGVSGLPLKLDKYKLDRDHNFPAIVDNHAKTGSHFKVESKREGGVFSHYSDLYQLEGELDGKSGVFEWVVDHGAVTHRRFIPRVGITGEANQVPGNKR